MVYKGITQQEEHDMTSQKTDLRKLFLDLAASQLQVAERYRQEAANGLRGAQAMADRALADADRYAKQAEAHA